MNQRVFSRRIMPGAADGFEGLEPVPDGVKRKIWKLLNEFNMPVRERASRYDSWEVHSDTFETIRDKLIEVYEVTRDSDFPQIDEEFIWNRDPVQLFDVLELWSQFLGGSEALAFEQAANQIFIAEQFPWLLAHGRVFRIDLGYVENQIVQPVFACSRRSSQHS